MVAKNPENNPAQIADSIEANRTSHRRSHFRKKLILSVIFAFLLLIILLFGRERLARQEYNKTLQLLTKKIDTFKSNHGNLPNQNQFQQFNVKSRNLSSEALNYQIDQIVSDSPPESILVYSPILQSRFYPPGCGIIRLDGQIKWFSAAELEKQIAKDLQFYHSSLLKSHTSPRLDSK